MSARREPAFPGVVFENAPYASVHIVKRVDAPRPIVYGNARGQIFNGDIASWGFAAVRLERRLPHLVLENVRGFGLIATEAEEGVRRGQRLRLEGDFDRTFALHVPQGYERDALYLFTPDVMQRVLYIPDRLDLDIEIVDDWLLVYSPKPIRGRSSRGRRARGARRSTARQDRRVGALERRTRTGSRRGRDGRAARAAGVPVALGRAVRGRDGGAVRLRRALGAAHVTAHAASRCDARPAHGHSSPGWLCPGE